MKTKLLSLACLAVGIVGLVHLIGCATQNPNAVQNPQTGAWSAPPYQAADFSSLSNKVSQVAGALAPVNPYAGITGYVINGGFGLAGLIAGAVAAFKNRNAVVTSMAQSVVQAGTHAAVLDQASNTAQFSAIADAINNALAPAQNPSGKPPS